MKYILIGLIMLIGLMGLVKAGTTTYLPNSPGNESWAKSDGGGSSSPTWSFPTYPDNLTATQKDTISTDDTNYVQVNGPAGTTNHFRMKFQIDEAIEDISEIKVTVKTYSLGILLGDSINLYSTNYTSSSWRLGNAYTEAGNPFSKQLNQTVTITDGFPDYINESGNFEVLLWSDAVRGGGPGLNTQLWYMEVNVTTAEADPCTPTGTEDFEIDGIECIITTNEDTGAYLTRLINGGNLTIDGGNLTTKGLDILWTGANHIYPFHTENNGGLNII